MTQRNSVARITGLSNRLSHLRKVDQGVRVVRGSSGLSPRLGALVYSGLSYNCCDTRVHTKVVGSIRRGGGVLRRLGRIR